MHLADGGGQALITATEPEHVPASEAGLLAVSAGSVHARADARDGHAPSGAPSGHAEVGP